MKQMNEYIRKAIVVVIGAGICLSACKKGRITYTASGSINITNAMQDGAILSLDSFSVPIANQYNMVAMLPAGQNTIDLFVPATPATTTTAALPAVTYYDQSLMVADGGNYSLFLTGTYPRVDTVLIDETYTSYSDSVFGVRFINLSTGSNPVSADIQGNANGSEISSLAYLAYSPFKQYPAGIAVQSYAFEVRDAQTGNLITTYTLSPYAFQHVTLALTGPAGGSQRILQVNDFTAGNTVY